MTGTGATAPCARFHGDRSERGHLDASRPPRDASATPGACQHLGLAAAHDPADAWSDREVELALDLAPRVTVRDPAGAGGADQGARSHPGPLRPPRHRRL